MCVTRCRLRNVLLGRVWRRRRRRRRRGDDGRANTENMDVSFRMLMFVLHSRNASEHSLDTAERLERMVMRHQIDRHIKAQVIQSFYRGYRFRIAVVIDAGIDPGIDAGIDPGIDAGIDRCRLYI